MIKKKSVFLKSFIIGIAALFMSSSCMAAPAAIAASSAESLPDEVIPLGYAAGIRLYAKGAIVSDFTEVDSSGINRSPGKEAGIRINDVVTALNGQKIETIDDVISFMANANEATVEVTFMRGDERRTANVTPARSKKDGSFKLGLVVRDSEAGIGTLTYLDPQTGVFGGLGHGIQDAYTGELFNMKSGDVSDIAITNIVKASRDGPGEIQGIFISDAPILGSLYKNSPSGVYGNTSKTNQFESINKVVVAKNGEITEGKAEILSNVLSNNVERFAINIEKVYNLSGGDNKNMLIKVTDDRLLNATGGIIQGMSGSPIMQNGKLVGAVTHVLVHDPSKGYAVSIENMLDNSTQSEIIKYAS